MTQTDPGLEAITTAAWLYARLTGDPELQDLAGGAEALADLVVEGTHSGDPDWYVAFTLLPPVDVKAVGLIQVFATVQVQVKVVGRTASYAPLIPVYRRVHALLEGQTIPMDAAQGSVLTFGRVSGIQFPEQVNGIQYRHLGGLYEALTQ